MVECLTCKRKQNQRINSEYDKIKSDTKVLSVKTQMGFFIFQREDKSWDFSDCMACAVKEGTSVEYLHFSL
jgi:hypothetical protein